MPRCSCDPRSRMTASAAEAPLLGQHIPVAAFSRGAGVLGIAPPAPKSNVSMRPQPTQSSKTMRTPIAATHSRPVQYSQNHAYRQEAPTPPPVPSSPRGRGLVEPYRPLGPLPPRTVRAVARLAPTKRARPARRGACRRDIPGQGGGSGHLRRAQDVRAAAGAWGAHLAQARPASCASEAGAASRARAPAIQARLLLNRHRIAAINLGPTGQPRTNVISTIASTGLDLFIIRQDHRAWTYYGHPFCQDENARSYR